LAYGQFCRRQKNEIIDRNGYADARVAQNESCKELALQKGTRLVVDVNAEQHMPCLVTQQKKLALQNIQHGFQ
jgi:hypothetical protein